MLCVFTILHTVARLRDSGDCLNVYYIVIINYNGVQVSVSVMRVHSAPPSCIEIIALLPLPVTTSICISYRDLSLFS